VRLYVAARLAELKHQDAGFVLAELKDQLAGSPALQEAARALVDEGIVAASAFQGIVPDPPAMPLDSPSGYDRVAAYRELARSAPADAAARLTQAAHDDDSVMARLGALAALVELDQGA
jgi:hypothetical protein